MHDDQDQGMETRALLAIVLSMGLLAAYQVFFVGAPAPVPEPGTGVEAAAPEEGSERVTPAPTPLPVVGQPAGGAESRSVLTAVAEETVRIESEAYAAMLTNRGGRLRSFILHGYAGVGTAELDLVHPRAAGAGRLPLELLAPTLSGNAAANEALYVTTVSGGRQREGRYVATADSPVRVRMEWSDGAGWAVTKEMVFPSAGHQVQLRVTASAPGAAPVYVLLGPGLDRVPDTSRQTFLSEQAVALLEDGSLEGWPPATDASATSLPVAARWVGVESYYFLGAFLLDRTAEIWVDSATMPPAPGSDEGAALARMGVKVPVDGLAATIYLGPKKYDYLAEQGFGLRRAVDFGFFGFLARPLLALLVWIDSFASNYGVSIILLTVLLRVVFLPLNHKAMMSMRKMQGLQPQMASIRAKYAGAKDMEKRQQMNEEVMALYRREGVSPFGGCLPMLAQLPILFSFYRLLSVAVELRQAPFALWITDLSQADPYLVLPLAMGGSMIVQQRMTPSAGMNPSQARMMQLMPIVFTLLFLSVPSGLVLYWLVNNLLGIAQQVYVNRKVGGESGGGTTSKPVPKSQRGKR